MTSAAAAPARRPSLCLLRLDAEVTRFDEYWRRLDESERRRASRFRRDVDRLRSVVARGSLRGLLGERLGTAAAEIVFGTNAWGKPVLQSPAHRLYFNTSHAGDWIAHARQDQAPGGNHNECVRAHHPPLHPTQPDLHGLAADNQVTDNIPPTQLAQLQPHPVIAEVTPARSGRFGAPAGSFPGRGGVSYWLGGAHDLADVDALHRVFAEPELCRLRAVASAKQRARAVAVQWVRKEAYVKAVGEGLSRLPQGIEIDTDASGRPRLRRDAGAQPGEHGWRFDDFAPDGNHVGCLVWRSDDNNRHDHG